MLKKLVALGLAVGIALTGTGVVNAEETAVKVEVKSNIAKAEEIAEEVNRNVEGLIKEAQDEASELSTENYDQELHVIIKELQHKARALSKEGVKEIRALGVKAKCEYTYVEIGNRTVKVDPIKVIF